MTDSSRKISELPVTTNLYSTDRILVLYNTPNSSTMSTRTIKLTDFAANISPYIPNTVTVTVNSVMSNTAPSNSASAGIPGTIAYDNQYLYICTSNNKWMRTHLLSW